MADDLSLLFRIKAKNEASQSLKDLERQMASLKERIKEIRQESDIPFKKERIATHTASLKELQERYKALKAEQKEAADSQKDLESALSSIIPKFGALASAGGPIALAAIGIAATTVAVKDLTEALFESAKAAADYQGKLFDLSQQTGVTVETLSALEITAAQTGGNIDSVSASLGIFQKNMVEADDAASKAHKTFASLGVIVSDTETTFSDTLKALAAMPEGFRQTNAALELFGRGGKQVLAIVKETGGNLDLLKERLRDVGLVTTEQAKRADEFNDLLSSLGFQLRGLGTDIIPAATDAVKEFSKFLKDNKTAIEGVNTGLGALAQLIAIPFKGALLLGGEAVNSFTRTLELLHLQAKEPVVITIKPKVSSEDADLLRQMKLLDVTKPLDKPKTTPTSRGSQVDVGAQLIKSLSGELRGLTEQTRSQEIAAELLDKKYSKLNSTVRTQIIAIASEIDLKKLQIQNEKDLAKATEDRQRQLERERDAGLGFIDQQTEQINKLKGVTKSAFDEATAALGLFGDALSENERELIRVNARTIQLLKNAQTLRDELDKIDLTPGPTGTLGGLPNIADILGEDAPEAEKRFRGLQSALDDLGASIGDVFGASENFKTDFGDVVNGAINDMAQGIGSLVEQWVLLGDTGPDAMRKLTASVLAGLAAQAAVKAVFQLAEGFAALFFNPAEAAAHFTSAALFGSIAGVAAVAGRSVAGNIFKPSAAGAGGTTSGSQGALQTITQGRNQPQPVHVTVVVKPDGSRFGEAITAHVVKNIGDGGEIREVIANDGRAA